MTDFITGNKFKRIADFYLDEDKNFVTSEELQSFKVAFIKTDWLHLFKSKILPLIKTPFILITHNADTASPLPHLDLINDQRVLKWYGMNSNFHHVKFHPIPIGIANEKWLHGDEKILSEVINTSVTKINRVYCNFDPNTNPVRYNILKSLQKYNFIDFEDKKLNFKEYLLKLKSYKWVISPPGNSIDCHRIWESIYVDTIPIVQDDICHNFWKNLPIHFIKTFDDIDFLDLENKYIHIKNNDKQLAYFSYYKKII